MKGLIVVAGALVLAACSGKAADTGPVATETASAASAKASAKTEEEEAPLTAATCIERAKGTGMRAEIARPCHEEACDKGDARACEILKNYDGYAAAPGKDDGEEIGEAETAPE